MTRMSWLWAPPPPVNRAVRTPPPQALSKIRDPAGCEGSNPHWESNAWAGGPVAVSAAF